jgi:hypothetical protein
MYKKLPTYKKVLVDHHSMNLKLQNRLLVAFCMSQVESLRLLRRAPPILEKAYDGI